MIYLVFVTSSIFGDMCRRSELSFPCIRRILYSKIDSLRYMRVQQDKKKSSEYDRTIKISSIKSTIKNQEEEEDELILRFDSFNLHHPSDTFA